MSGSGGKLAVLKEQARQAAATAPGRAIGQAAREEIQPILDRLDALPGRFQEAAGTSAESLRESLLPMVAEVASLRSSLAGLPALMAQQMDGVVAQVQAEGLSMRKEIGVLRSSLATLPDALAVQMAPIMAISERLDAVLTLQRTSLAALHEASLDSFRVALDPTAERIETALGALTQQSRQTGGALQGMKALPQEIRDATRDVRAAGTETVAAIRNARGSGWRLVAQAVATAVLTAALMVGGLTWVGTRGSSGLPPLVGQNAKAQAWDSLYRQAPPEWRAVMDQSLAASPGR